MEESMSELNLLEISEEFATRKHLGQKRRISGEPYINHPCKVASLLRNNHSKIIAWLHDTIEDTDATFNDIEEVFGVLVTKDIKVLTHYEDESYKDYIVRIKKSDIRNSFYTSIKTADIVANLSDNPTTKQIQKYYDALRILQMPVETFENYKIGDVQ
jgi:GTP diphosphokinase / guanosine-3',5'-bis(diphosphate) 3'-diphosphatase